MKKYILFDNDGVLVETEIWYYRASAKVLKTMGIDMSPESYKEIMINGLSSFVLAERVGFDKESIFKARAKRDEIYQHYLQTENITIDGIKEVLTELQEQYKMAIITTSRRVDFELIHASRGIVDYMDFVLCVEDYPRAKPHPDPYLKGLTQFRAKKENAIVVEDSQRGLRSAIAAEIDCIIVQNDFTTSHDFSTATHRIDKLSELKSLLNRL